MAKESFVMFKAFYEPTKLLSLEDKGILWNAIHSYQIDGEIIEMPIAVKMCFEFYKNQFRLDDVKYAKRVESNKVNGAKGGRPKTNLTQQKPINPLGYKEPKKADKDNVNGNEKDNGNDKGNKKKKPKKNLHLDCIKLTDDEYDKLIEQFTEPVAKERIENLNNYVMSKGATYKSHYHTILAWERKNPINNNPTNNVSEEDKAARKNQDELEKEELRKEIERRGKNGISF